MARNGTKCWGQENFYFVSEKEHWFTYLENQNSRGDPFFRSSPESSMGLTIWLNEINKNLLAGMPAWNSARQDTGIESLSFSLLNLSFPVNLKTKIQQKACILCLWTLFKCIRKLPHHWLFAFYRIEADSHHGEEECIRKDNMRFQNLKNRDRTSQ